MRWARIVVEIRQHSPIPGGGYKFRTEVTEGFCAFGLTWVLGRKDSIIIVISNKITIRKRSFAGIANTMLKTTRIFWIWFYLYFFTEKNRIIWSPFIIL